MAVDQNHQNLEMVAVNTLPQHLLNIDKRQVLGASLYKQIDQKYVPFHRFVQQPTAMLKPFNPSIIIPERTLHTDTAMQQQQQQQQQQQDDKEPALIARPVFVSGAEQLQPMSCMNNEIVVHEGGMGSRAPICQLPYHERKENWIKRRLPRSKLNRWDTYYVHLKTDVQFRSLVGVHAFIVYGLLPERRKAKTVDAHNNSTSINERIKSSPSPKVRGDKLLNRIEVGRCNPETGVIFRTETSSLEAGDSVLGRGAKRKRENDDEAPSEDTTGDLTYALYDFEPIF